ncbi:hypothetical protein BJP36_42650 [Moorena producens JHB]|uniref:Uncharacterized protein n=1 Tax=Moorena producens (strain JHB) TaxID=1454205 RepID=A0A9Q9SSY9_MOOP1|nr:hypothetical protein [Moorena producens]WAN69058.1 hypothetical protein BJP36_42650 [Moorena producens JHB]
MRYTGFFPTRLHYSLFAAPYSLFPIPCSRFPKKNCYKISQNML